MDSANPGELSASAKGTYRFPWMTLLVLAAGLFMIDHDLSQPERMELLTSAQTLQDVDGVSEMIEQSGLYRQLGSFGLGVFGLGYLLLRGRFGARRLHLLDFLMLAFMGWMAISVFWAQDPAMSARRLVMFAMLIFIAFAAARRFTLNDILLFAVLIPGLFVIIGIGNEIRYQSFAPWDAMWRFSGTLHPNAQAINCAILVLAALALARSHERHRWFFVIIALIAFAFLFLTKSRAALASTVVAAGVHWGFDQPGARRFAVICAVIAGASLFTLLSETLLPVMEKSVQLGRGEETAESLGTLTGRIPLWTQLLGYAWQRPWLGYGYGGFWTDNHIREVAEEQGWPISHAHNAYLDLTLETGPVGAVLFLLILIFGINRALRYQRIPGSTVQFGFLAVILMLCLFNGVLESAVVQRTELSFMTMLVLAYLVIHEPEINAAAARVSPETPAPVAISRLRTASLGAAPKTNAMGQEANG